MGIEARSVVYGDSMAACCWNGEGPDLRWPSLLGFTNRSRPGTTLPNWLENLEWSSDSQLDHGTDAYIILGTNDVWTRNWTGA